MSYLAAFSMAYPFSIATNEDSWAAVPDDLKQILVGEADAMWQEAVDRWAEGAAEKAAYEWLTTEGGMTMLDPVPLADREAIQAELLKIWKAQAEALGPTGAAYYERIVGALNAN
jgi:TRAP-type C4-dicarboxylate transport system substrate-binding protein